MIGMVEKYITSIKKVRVNTSSRELAKGLMRESWAIFIFKKKTIPQRQRHKVRRNDGFCEHRRAIDELAVKIAMRVKCSRSQQAGPPVKVENVYIMSR